MGGKLVIARERVAAPGYTLYVSAATSSNGWTYYPDELEKEDFALPWKQPAGVHDAYALGSIVSHVGSRWLSIIAGNVWEPGGVSGWVNADSNLPSWIKPTGVHDAYSKGAIVAHVGKLWKSLVMANVWEPGVENWRETALMPPSDETSLPEE